MLLFPMFLKWNIKKWCFNDIFNIILKLEIKALYNRKIYLFMYTTNYLFTCLCDSGRDILKFLKVLEKIFLKGTFSI